MSAIRNLVRHLVMRKECGACHGNGYYPNGKTCTLCHGTGEI